MKKFAKKETCHYSYHVVVEFFSKGERFVYGSYYSARKLFTNLNKRAESDSSIKCLSFDCVCMRYDNFGNLNIGVGKTKQESYNDSLRDYKLPI